MDARGPTPARQCAPTFQLSHPTSVLYGAEFSWLANSAGVSHCSAAPQLRTRLKLAGTCARFEEGQLASWKALGIMGTMQTSAH